MTRERGGRSGGSGPSGRRKSVRVKTARGRKSSSTRWLLRQLNDPYVAEAKARGYRSRAAFKLLELDDKLSILRPGAVVLDLGAAPGGWSQVAVERIKDGRVVAVDITEIEPLAGAVCLQLDIFDEDAPERIREALGDGADVVLSDMAPASTGHAATDHLRIIALAEAAYDVAQGLLQPRRGVRRQGAAGRHRGRALDPLETALSHGAPRQAAGKPPRLARALCRGTGFPPAGDGGTAGYPLTRVQCRVQAPLAVSSSSRVA